MATHVALIYPPSCDPTAPYLAVPMLTGYLRAHGVSVLPIDANIEAYDALLARDSLAAVRDRIEARLGELERRPSLDHEAQLAYLALWRARGDAHAVPYGIEEAKAILRSEEEFFEPARYAAATATIEAALRAVSASYHPLHLDFTAYRTPFALTTMDEIARDADERDPFDSYLRSSLIPRLEAAAPAVIGLSVCFPGQMQPAYAFARKLRAALPGVHLTVGGPAMTQMLIRLQGQRLAAALGPFDSAVVYEGEESLLGLVRALDEGRPVREVPNIVVRDPLQGARWLPGHGMMDLKTLPAPDFDGLPLDRYLSPRLTLPYDPTRGCYWGKCTFCHYGLAEVGTAAYREREVATMVAHLRTLSERHGTRYFYLSQDSVAPKTLVKLAEGLIAAGLELRWATDLKGEKYLTPARAEVLRRGGGVACAIGVESAAPRVLSLIDKGAPIDVIGDVVERLTDAGIAAEAMCFTDFPTESASEAMATLRWLDEHREQIACFIVGTFGLTHGALVAQEPQRFGLREIWQLEGDELGLGLFYGEKRQSKSAREREDIDDALAELSSGWLLRAYPWAGAVSTAHTVLYYDRFGPDALRSLAAQPLPRVLGNRPRFATARFDLRRAEGAEAREAEIWYELVHVRRRVSRAEYGALAQSTSLLAPGPRPYRFAAGELPRPARGRGRRPSHAPNAASRTGASRTSD